MKRDNGLIIALVIQASINAAAGSASLAQIAPAWLVAAVGLMNSMLLAGTAAYVAATRGTQERQAAEAVTVAAQEAAETAVANALPATQPKTLRNRYPSP